MLCNVPAPFPEECLLGYGHRISSVNGQSAARPGALLRLIETETGISISNAMKNHTHLGYLRFVDDMHAGKDVVKHRDLMSNSRLLSGTPSRSHASYCPKCIEADLADRGLSYWRRRHQLPGVDHCIEHSVALVETAPMSMTKCQPLNAAVIGSAIEKASTDRYYKSEPIQRFVALSLAALKSSIPTSSDVVTGALNRQMQLMFRGKQGSLKKLAIQTFPSFWLEKHFHLLYVASTASRQSAADEVARPVRNALVTKFFLLAMALLWKDPHDAIHACIQAPNHDASMRSECLAQKALRDVLLGSSIGWSCRQYGVGLREFDEALQGFLKQIEPVTRRHLSKL